MNELSIESKQAVVYHPGSHRQRQILLLALLLTGLLLASHALAQQTMAQRTVQVSRIVSPTSVEVISGNASRERIELAAIAVPDSPERLKPPVIKRMQSLLLGRTLQLQKVSAHKGLLFYGGLNIAERLLSEGLALPQPADLPLLSPGMQRQLLAAAEQARLQRRGLWAITQSTPLRYHQPLWPADRLPSPITHAPVYKPEPYKP